MVNGIFLAQLQNKKFQYRSQFLVSKFVEKKKEKNSSLEGNNTQFNKLTRSLDPRGNIITQGRIFAPAIQIASITLSNVKEVIKVVEREREVDSWCHSSFEKSIKKVYTVDRFRGVAFSSSSAVTVQTALEHVVVAVQRGKPWISPLALSILVAASALRPAIKTESGDLTEDFRSWDALVASRHAQRPIETNDKNGYLRGIKRAKVYEGWASSRYRVMRGKRGWKVCTVV